MSHLSILYHTHNISSFAGNHADVSRGHRSRLVHSEQRGCRRLPGRCDQLLQQSVSGDERRLSVDGSRLLSGLVSATGRELLTGGDLSGSDAVLAEILTHNNNNNNNAQFQ